MTKHSRHKKAQRHQLTGPKMENSAAAVAPTPDDDIINIPFAPAPDKDVNVIKFALKAINDLDIGYVEQIPEQLASLFERFVTLGSKLHTVAIVDIHVYYTPAVIMTDEMRPHHFEVDDKLLGADLKGLLFGGAKFLDAIIYLSLPIDSRPKPLTHDEPEDKSEEYSIAVWNDLKEITRYMFFMYFYILIRAHAPSIEGEYRTQSVPKFLTTVLGITSTTPEIADYLASFSLSSIDPAWVKYIRISGLGQEAISRFGLGVAGYRICSVMNYVSPDLDDWEEFAEALSVARSFLRAGLCWDFHPATRSGSILTMYGNINKNCSNLLTLLYKEATLTKLKDSKKLAVMPVFDHAHANYTMWSESMKYVATSPIFGPVSKNIPTTYLTEGELKRVEHFKKKRDIDRDLEKFKLDQELEEKKAEVLLKQKGKGKA